MEPQAVVWETPEFDEIGVMVGSFDRPDRVPPVVQYGVESRVSWYRHLPELPGDKPTYSVDPRGYLPRIRASNRQHPDHDTVEWPLRSHFRD